jgi:hypothetical protein
VSKVRVKQEWEWLVDREVPAQLYKQELRVLCRMKVPGGWLLTWGNYEFTTNAEKFLFATTEPPTFYADPGHAWDGSSLPSSAPAAPAKK